MSRHIVLLGPQRLEPTLRSVVDRIGIQGAIATITAGWEERDGEDAELARHLGGRTRNLGLFQRAESVFREDRELHRAMWDRHDRLRALSEVYRARLAHVLASARELFERPDAEDWLEPQRAHAIELVRSLDEFHLEQRRQVLDEFDERMRPTERDSIQPHRRELGEILEDSDALCIAGGHVAILLNRLLMFGIFDLLPPSRTVIAWSAGAMVLSERIVLFHDCPPQGAGDAEVFLPGLGIARGVVPLPHAGHRLRLDDRARVALFARRFAPALCVALLPRTGIECLPTEGEDPSEPNWIAEEGTCRLDVSGELVPVGKDTEESRCRPYAS